MWSLEIWKFENHVFLFIYFFFFFLFRSQMEMGSYTPQHKWRHAWRIAKKNARPLLNPWISVPHLRQGLACRSGMNEASRINCHLSCTVPWALPQPGWSPSVHQAKTKADANPCSNLPKRAEAGASQESSEKWRKGGGWVKTNPAAETSSKPVLGTNKPAWGMCRIEILKILKFGNL